MVTESEREELGRLTYQKLTAYSQQKQEKEEQAGIQPGRMTMQNLKCMKTVQHKSNNTGARLILMMERLKMAFSTTISGLFAPSLQQLKEDKCKVYGHNLPWGTPWKGPFPRCLDCGAKITESGQLRVSVTLEERRKFRSYGEN